jgi:hypothetical protein
MHCKAEQQKIMAKLFKEILKDLYILDDDNPPETYPTPEELKGKFIIKEGREKIFKKVKKNVEIDIIDDEDEIEENDLIDEFDKDCLEEIRIYIFINN